MKKQNLVPFESFVGKTIDEFADYMFQLWRRSLTWKQTGSEEGWSRYLHWPTGFAVQVFYENGIVTKVLCGNNV
jgi:hypothetical protein